MRTPIVNLGESGLAEPGVLEFRLYLEGGNDPVVLDASGLTPHEIGTSGDYYVDGIILVTGESASLVIVRAADPLLALFTVPLSAPAPPPVVVYRRQVIVDPFGPITQHDTLGIISVVVRSGLPENPVTGGYSATFSLRTVEDPALVIDHEAAAVSEPVLDALTDSWGATISYQLTAPATAADGRYLGTFKLTTGGGAVKTITVPPLEIRVFPDIGG